MFSKTSRYYRLPDVVAADIKGRSLESRAIRPHTGAPAAFSHTIEEGDRLDHLASKYYRQPRKWWRICDADTEFSSPQGMLGKDGMVAYRFHVTSAEAEPPWSALLCGLRESAGIEAADGGSDEEMFPETLLAVGALLFSIAPALAAALAAGVLTQELSSPLRQAFSDKGVEFAAGISLSLAGPDHWRITDLFDKETYSVRLEAGVLNVYETHRHHSWIITVVFNTMNLQPHEVLQLIEDAGFSAGETTKIGRAGKPLAIPRDVTG